MSGAPTLEPTDAALRSPELLGVGATRTASAANDDRTAGLVAVVPVHDGGDDIERCLDALVAAGQSPDAVVVADDASRDGRAERAAAMYGTRYVRLDGGPFGPARARNAGAALVPDADAYLFVDADVTVRSDVPDAFRALLDAEGDVAAAFGSYDDDPPAGGWISRYKNLLHHWMHQRGDAEACTFWSGCGVVRGTAFRRHGGFDEGFGAASIEDVDLGLRLSDAGERVRLDPDIQCTHWKRWTLKSWLRTDILARALPWSRLLVARGEGVPDTLNLGAAERASAMLACLGLACAGLVLVPGARPFAATGAAACAAGFCALQWPLIRFFARRGGGAFAAAATLMHVAYFVYSSVVYGTVVVASRLAPRRRARSAPTATSTPLSAGRNSRKSKGTR